MGKLIRPYLSQTLAGLWWLTLGAYALLALGHTELNRETPVIVAALAVSGLAIGVRARRILIAFVVLFGLWALSAPSLRPLLAFVAAGLTLAFISLIPWFTRQRTVLGHHRLLAYPVSITTRDRFLHTHVLGPTGSGKSSSVLMPMIWQDLSQGHGLCLIEPKGDLSVATFQAALATGHTVLYVDPEDHRAPHYNPLSGPADVAAEGLAWALDQTGESGHPFYATLARLELLYAVLAVKETGGDEADLEMVMRFLRQEGFRREVLSACRDARTLAYYAEQVGRQSQAKALEQRIGLLNRLELLLVNPRVRILFEGPGDFTWDQVLAERHVVIGPFSLANLGATARLLGNLFWHGMVMATYRRPLEDRRPYFLYLDEFHQYVSPDLGDYLALARGYSVGITLAHQDLGQLRPELKTAVMANCRQRVILGGISVDDAKELAPLFGRSGNQIPDLRHLPLGHAWVERTEGGRLRRPVPLKLIHRPLGAGSAP